MSESSSSDRTPKAIIHKRILDVAEERPEASVDVIAEEVSGASSSLVERVLEDYGDPARTGPTDSDTPAVPDDGGDATAADETDGDESGVVPPAVSELSADQREILQGIERDPDATQRELADRLDVSASTISKRVQSIPGFEWERRAELVSRVDGLDPSSDGGDRPADSDEDEGQSATDEDEGQSATDIEGRFAELERDLERLRERIEKRERRFEDADHEATSESAPSAETDPELLAKAVRACVADERISETEETALIAELLG